MTVAPEAGLTAAEFTTPGPDGEPDSGDENTVTSFILKPTADHGQENLESDPRRRLARRRTSLCEGVDAATGAGGLPVGRLAETD